jgi:hypothetical protein
LLNGGCQIFWLPLNIAPTRHSKFRIQAKIKRWPNYLTM